MIAFIGIDVGKGGAVCLLTSDGTTSCMVTPTLPDGDIDSRFLYEHVRSLSREYEIKMVVIEKVHAIFGAGAKSTFEFGRSAGIVESIVCALGLPFTMVPPKVWQKEMWSGVDKVMKPNKSVDTKATSLVAAKRLFPNSVLTDTGKPKSKKAHDGIVDAILLAEYGRRIWKGKKE